MESFKELVAKKIKVLDLPLFPGVDSLASHPGNYFDVVLTNPPFGKKSSTTIIGANGKPYKEKETIEREDCYKKRTE